MAARINHKSLLKKLKKQVRVLQRKEEKSRNKLRNALKKLRKHGRAQKTKLASQIRMMKGKIAEAQATTYAKIASDIERQMMRNIEAKGKALKTAIGKLEMKHVAKLKKTMAKKGRKIGKVKKTLAKKTAVAKKLKREYKKQKRRTRKRRTVK